MYKMACEPSEPIGERLRFRKAPACAPAYAQILWRMMITSVDTVEGKLKIGARISVKFDGPRGHEFWEKALVNERVHDYLRWRATALSMSSATGCATKTTCVRAPALCSSSAARRRLARRT